MTGKAPSLPDLPEPCELELEFTNVCNAACTACPRNALTAPRGFMAPVTLRAIIDAYADYRTGFAINRLRVAADYPFVTVAGLGEPLLHPRAFEFLAYATRCGFRTLLFTNASRLGPGQAERLADTGVHTVYVSFWGIRKEEYEAAMRLPFEPALRNVDHLATVLADRAIRLLITWVQVPQLRSTPVEIGAFWRARGIQVDVHDDAPEHASASNAAWNRGGLVTGIPAADSHGVVDFSREYWCSQLYFTDTVAWNGDVLLCSQDYFQKSVVLGNLSRDHPRDIARRKQAIFAQRPAVCVWCRKPRDYSIATHPWDAVLPASELARYRYDVPRAAVER